MKLTYDTEADALLIELAAGDVERTVEVGPGTLVDLDRDARALAIEVIRPARTWPPDRVLACFGLEDCDRAILAGIWAARPTLELCELAPLPAA